MRLKIPFSEISEHGLRLEVHEDCWLPEELSAGAGPVAAALQLTRKGEARVEVQGSMQAEIQLQCDRCLADYRCALSAPLQLLVETADSQRHWRVHDIEHQDGPLEIIRVDKPVVDVGDILRQQVYLALPTKRLCREDCPGICPQCGETSNTKDCDCEGSAGDSPFQVLAKLKKDNRD